MTDAQPSFLFAETFKYIYMAFAPGKPAPLSRCAWRNLASSNELTKTRADADWQISPDGKDKWVFNTEAHPIKVKG